MHDTKKRSVNYKAENISQTQVCVHMPKLEVIESSVTPYIELTPFYFHVKRVCTKRVLKYGLQSKAKKTKRENKILGYGLQSNVKKTKYVQ